MQLGSDLFHLFTTLHVSGASCTHHQEYITVYAAPGTSAHRETTFLRGRISCEEGGCPMCTRTRGCIYSYILLMIDARSARNM